MSKILVIDDDEKLSGLIKDFLEPYKFQVACFAHPEKALSKLKSIKPELIILDIMLPDMDGFQCLRKIRESHQKK